MRNHLAALVAVLALAAPATAKTTPKAAAAAAVWTQAGLERLSARDLGAAIKLFDQAARGKPSASAYFLLGWAHYQRGFSGKTPEEAVLEDALAAAAAFEKALSLEPSLASVPNPHRLHTSLALCREAARDHEGAMLAYKAAFKAAPSNAMIPLHAARLRHKMGDAEKAAADLAVSLDRARKLGKMAEIARLVRTDRLFMPLLKNERARKLLAAAESAEKPEQTLAMHVAASEELRDALRDTKPKPTAADRAIGRGSAASEGRKEAADTELAAKLAEADAAFKARRWRPAADAYGAAVAMNVPFQKLGRERLAAAYERMGTAYNQLGLTHEAVRALQSSLAHLPGGPAAHYQLALAYSRSGRLDASLQSLGQALKSAPNGGERRKFELLAKTDVELEPVRDLPAFRGLVPQKG